MKGICKLLTPMDIHNKEFKRGFRGYNEKEVDDFLDQVVKDYEKLQQDNEKLRAELARNQKDIEQYQKLEKNIQDTLLVAQRTAEQVTSSAKQFSEELRENSAKECQSMKLRAELEAKKKIEEADRYAQKTMDSAKASAQRKMDDAERTAQKQVDDAAAKVRAIVAEYDRLVREKNKFLMKVRSAMESELAIVNDALSSVPHPEEYDAPQPKAQARRFDTEGTMEKFGKRKQDAMSEDTIVMEKVTEKKTSAGDKH